MSIFTIDDDAIRDPLGALRDAAYQVGGLQLIPYDSTREDIFPQPYLYGLYEKTRNSGRAKLGSLPALFCGMTNFGPDAICNYLLNNRVAVLGEWRHAPLPLPGEDPLPNNFEELCQPYFHALGYVFPTVLLRSPNGLQNAGFAGYCFFEEAWRTKQQFILSYIGLAYLFHEFHLVRLNGVRYEDNKLTSRWMERFGFQDIAVIPNWMSKPGHEELVPGVFSTLTRYDFEEQLRQIFLRLRDDEAGL